MDEPVEIRAERAADHAIIADVVRRAYADVSYSDHGEHRMVARLREGSAFVPDLSLLAIRGGAVAGHVLLVRVAVEGSTDLRSLLVLAPLSVAPEHQGIGVGAALVRAAHERAARLGFAAIVLVGPPGYYRRFGYQPLTTTGLTLPFAVPEPQRMIFPLAPGAVDGLRGSIRFPAGWLEH